MQKENVLVSYLFGHKAKFAWVLGAGFVMMLCFLGAKDLWTQEHRWADIVWGMFYRQDFLHPYIGETRYYDKPLLSYWLMVLVAKLIGSLNTWALRLPSVAAGVLALWSSYHLGTFLKDRRVGLLSAWMLLTTYYFVFWARVSSADMLNLAGVLLAITWYYTHRMRRDFLSYFVFFVIVALTSLCKGLGGAVLPVIAVLVDVVMQRKWFYHVNFKLLLALVPALILYLAPFLASSYFGGDQYQENGLYLVYKENILRYFQPFDHKGPIYTYFIYLPLYMLPWTLFFVPALFSIKKRWSSFDEGVKWLHLTMLALFVFFTLSGSRRSYYVLPLVPFAILITALWILDVRESLRKANLAALTIVLSYVLLFIAIDLVPAWYYTHSGAATFAAKLEQEAEKQGVWNPDKVIALDAVTKLNFYLKLPPQAPYYSLAGDRDKQTTASLLKAWPILKDKPKGAIFITRRQYMPLLKEYFKGYDVVMLDGYKDLPWGHSDDANDPVAYIPRQK